VLVAPDAPHREAAADEHREEHDQVQAVPDRRPEACRDVHGPQPRSALLIIADFAAYFWPGRNTVGLDALAFILTLILAGYAMWRVWRAERTYGY